MDLTVRALFEGSLTANTVIVRIPVPSQTAKAVLKVSKGKAKYEGTESAIIWKISKFGSDRELSLYAEVLMVSTTREKKAWNRCASAAVVDDNNKPHVFLIDSCQGPCLPWPASVLVPLASCSVTCRKSVCTLSL